MEQKILVASENYSELDQYIEENDFHRILLVCDDSIRYLRLHDYFNQIAGRMNIEVIRFSDFQPNPLYESVEKGVALFEQKECDTIIAIGGGSAIDIAKCIKLYCYMDHSKNFLKQDIVPNDIKLLAIPTTAGTGSEATKYAVIYYEGEKQSIADESCIPTAVLMDSTVLKTLPLYQKKATMMDAFCHAIESFWSVNSTEKSKEYSREAIHIILRHMKSYLRNEDEGNAAMLHAANIAGKAINITQTTAGHAMCYKLTSLYGIAHGHAAALCDVHLISYMGGHIDKCIDPRGKEYLSEIVDQLAREMGCKSIKEAAEKFSNIITELGLNIPKAKADDYVILKSSVNLVRLKNHPVLLDGETIDKLYHEILK